MDHLIREDGYINATMLCKESDGKLFADYKRKKKTQLYLQTLSDYLKISVSELIDIKQGGSPKLQGTWVHPYIATNLAQWISSTFAIKVSMWIDEWKKTNDENNIKYISELMDIKADNYNDDIEKQIQKKLHEQLGGSIEVETEFGYIDLLTDISIIEIKDGYNWKHGFGQLIVYSQFYPNHIKILHLFNISKNHKIDEFCFKYDVIVKYE